MSAPGRTVPDTEVAALVEALRSAPGGGHDLAALLAEQHPVHTGRSAAGTDHLRGYVLASFAGTGVPDEAWPYLIEALESGTSAYEVAGAAIGLRGVPGPDPEVLELLTRAVDRLAGADMTVSFESYAPAWPYRQPTTALTELVRTAGHFASAAGTIPPRLTAMVEQDWRFSAAVRDEMRRALAGTDGPAVPVASAHSCCAGHDQQPETNPDPAARGTVEDQDGRTEDTEALFHGRPTVVTFFYTRCDNPYKCSLTITKLAALQDRLAQRGVADAVNIAAITYDPAFDVPARLRRYGTDRGVRFSERTRFFRVTSSFADVRRRFGLGVNYGPSTVNRHRIEVHVLDAEGRIAASFTRRQWEVDKVADAVQHLLAPRAAATGRNGS